MTTDEMLEFAEDATESDDAYLNSARWNAIDPKFGTRADVHAFVLLDRIMPYKDGHNNLICWAGHDEIALCPDIDELAEVITKDQILDLLACGVRFDSEGLKMFM